MGKYLVTIYDNEAMWAAAGPEAAETNHQRHQAFAGRFGLMAAIAAVHVEAERWEDTDWTEILGLYDLLLARWPSPVVALNRLVALSYVDGPEVALRAPLVG